MVRGTLAIGVDLIGKMIRTMRIIAVTNQKGGCGKTTTAVNLSAALAQMGYRILLIDLDPQANATIGLGFSPDAFRNTVYQVLTGSEINITETVVRTRIEHLDLLPSNVMLSGAEHDLYGSLGKELVLAEKLRAVQDTYDFCVIDCVPTVGILALNALVASTDVIVPVQVHFYAIHGLHRLLETIQVINKRFYPCTVQMLGFLLTFVDNRTSMSKRVVTGMRHYFKDLVFNSMIHSNISLAEAPANGESVFTYAAHSRGAREYQSMTVESLYRLNRLEPLVNRSSGVLTPPCQNSAC
jgi:chromosome partitioning protein